MAETMASSAPAEKRELASQQRQSVVIVISGDSGDGMQLTGDQFTNTSAVLGNDVSTFPDIPAEIRAPAGTIPGLSGYQVNFSSSELYTAGDSPQVLVAMNPAALKANLPDLDPGGTIIVNTDPFNRNGLRKAGYEANPLEDQREPRARLWQKLCRDGLARSSRQLVRPNHDRILQLFRSREPE